MREKSLTGFLEFFMRKKLHGKLNKGEKIEKEVGEGF